MLNTLFRFTIGALIGLYLTGLFGNNPQAAVVAAVLGGVIVDQTFRAKRE
jgi:hypothetical protein